MPHTIADRHTHNLFENPLNGKHEFFPVMLLANL
jgi:hypothetical protein